jgi:hypothetical protein
MQALDQTIGRALALDVPELVLPELPDIESDNVVSLARGRRFSPPTWFAMAATVAVAAVLGVRLIGSGIEYESLAEEVLAHVDHEPYAMRVTGEAVTDKRLHNVVTADIAEMDHGAGLITYAQTCVINGHDVPHLVIQGREGPVMVLLMPEEMVDAAVELSGEHVNGVILPVGSGSIAIVGGRTEQLENIQEQVLNHLRFAPPKHCPARAKQPL